MASLPRKLHAGAKSRIDDAKAARREKSRLFAEMTGRHFLPSMKSRRGFQDFMAAADKEATRHLAAILVADAVG